MFTRQCEENDFRPQIWGLKCNSQFDPQVVESILVVSRSKDLISFGLISELIRIGQLQLPEKVLSYVSPLLGLKPTNPSKGRTAIPTCPGFQGMGILEDAVQAAC